MLMDGWVDGGMFQTPERRLRLLLSPGSQVCPRSLDCARAGRHFCQPGTSQCGPCLYPLVETSRGRCVVRRRLAPRPAQTAKGRCWPHTHTQEDCVVPAQTGMALCPPGKVSKYPELDEEIDFLSAVISEQRTITKGTGLVLGRPLGSRKQCRVMFCVLVAPAAAWQDPSGPAPSPWAPPEHPSVSPPTRAPNATSDLFGDPVVPANPSNDHVFVGESERRMNRLQ